MENSTERQQKSIPLNELVNARLRNRVREVRLERGMTQEKLAELTGLSRQSIQAIENEEFYPSAKNASILCKALRRRFEYLFYFEEVESLKNIRKESGDQ